MALVASVTTVAIISAYSVKFMQQGQGAQQTPVLQVAKNLVTKPQPAASSTFEYPLNKQIKDYLQAHNEGLKATPELSYQPYTQLSSYNQR